MNNVLLKNADYLNRKLWFFGIYLVKTPNFAIIFASL